jgi:hypothetical protein
MLCSIRFHIHVPIINGIFHFFKFLISGADILTAGYDEGLYIMAYTGKY